MTKKSHRNPVAPARARSRTPLLILGGIVLVAIAVVALVWIALTPNRGSNGGVPQLEVNTERLDLGKQIFESPVHASFDVRNTGNGTLTLSAPQYATLLEGC